MQPPDPTPPGDLRSLAERLETAARETIRLSGPKWHRDSEERRREDDAAREFIAAACPANVLALTAGLRQSWDAVAELTEGLHDAQNGPPLLKHKDAWDAAMAAAPPPAPTGPMQ